MKVFDFDFYRFPKAEKAKDMTVLFGASSAKVIPVAQLGKSFGFNFKIVNASVENLSVKNAKVQFKIAAESYKAEALIVQLGENDVELFKSNPSEFDSLYLDFISYLKYGIYSSKCLTYPTQALRRDTIPSILRFS